MRKILERCPSCGGEMNITRLNCRRCGTIVISEYQPCPFCRLAPETIDFVQAFVRNRGNLKEMERELGDSYWTLRARLNEVIEELGYHVEPEEGATQRAVHRRQILERLERGEIDVGAATELLAQIRTSDSE